MSKKLDHKEKIQQMIDEMVDKCSAMLYVLDIAKVEKDTGINYRTLYRIRKKEAVPKLATLKRLYSYVSEEASSLERFISRVNDDDI